MPTSLRAAGRADRPAVAESRREFVAALEVVAAQHGEATAIVDGDRHITFAALATEVENRCSQLTGAGLRTGDRVALVAENSADYLTSAFAVLKAGGVLVTIYPSSPPADLAFCIADADPVLVLVDEHTAAVVADALPETMPVVDVTGRFEVRNLRSDAAPSPEGLRAPLYLICYSSGTTSRPKAIMLSAESVFNGADVYADVWHLSASDTSVVALPMAWLYGLATTSMATLLRGGCVLVLRRSHPELLADAIASHRATFIAGVTTMFAKLVSYLDELETAPDLTSLRLCVSGGEPRNEAAFDRFEALSGTPVHDTFCASECFPLITYDPVADPRPVRGSAGRLVPGSLLRVVDEAGEDVAPGEVGEALAGGPGLFLGYWNDPELTRDALTADGWYRHQDLVRVDPDGYVYVVGRLSDMIIRGGSNVSPAEVEHVLRDHAAVRDVAVVGLPDDVYGQRVVAAVVVANGERLDSEELAALARSRLASFKVPTDFVRVDRLAVNATTGKVNRRAVADQLSRSGVRAT